MTTLRNNTRNDSLSERRVPAKVRRLELDYSVASNHFHKDQLKKLQQAGQICAIKVHQK
jgi:hypothetical protein